MPRLDQDFLTKKKVPELKTQARRKNIKPLPTRKADLIAALLGVDYAADQQWFIQAGRAAPARVPAVAAAAPARVQAPRAPVGGKPKYNISFFRGKGVAELRAQCALRGLSAVGTKPVLVDRLFAYNYLQHNQQFGVARPAQVPAPIAPQGGGQAPRPQVVPRQPAVPAPRAPQGGGQAPRAQVQAPRAPQVPAPQVPRPQVPRAQVQRAPQEGQVRTQEQIRKAIRDCLAA